jgi:hypothetical protein
VRVKAVLVAGLALVAIAMAIVLSGSPIRVIATDGVTPQFIVGYIPGYTRTCQGGETIPAGTSAVRFGLDAAIGPPVTVTVLSAGRLITHGTRGAGWAGGDVTVAVARVRREIAGATVCFAFGHSREVIAAFGEHTGTAVAALSAGRPLRGRVVLEYLAPGGRSWWSSALSVARRIGLGRAPSGTWIVLVLAALMAAAGALASWLIVRELREDADGDRARRTSHARSSLLSRSLGRVPTAAWVCAAVACLNGACWSILSPPFQTPDEPAHFAYVQQLAETGRLPTSYGEEYSPEEETALEDLNQGYVQFRPGAQTISSFAQQRKLEYDLAQPLRRVGSGGAGDAASEPPLYYALATIPYQLGSSGTLLERVQLIRLLSALFGGLTALFGFMFVREALPGAPWAWTVAGLGVALVPLLGFMSGAVNPDAMLAAVSSALFYLLARAFRRGLTPWLAAAIGAAIAVGLLTKLTFLGLVPGALLGLVVALVRLSRRSGLAAAVRVAPAFLLAASPALLYVASKQLVNGASVGIVSNSASNATQAGSLPNEISYIWQFYLPRLPGMPDYFPGIFTSRQLWFNGLTGLYGWADTVFPGWVYDLALIPAALLAALCARALVLGRATLKDRTVEALVYAIMLAGLLVLVGAASYVGDIVSHEGPFKEPRYLLPTVALFGVVLALAARGAGRRWGPAVGAAIVVLFLAHDLFSQLQVISSYYG